MALKNSFHNRFQESCQSLDPLSIDIVQVNVGLKCNKECSHCHLEAGPDRTEIITKKTMENVESLISHVKPELVDITGGAPELNPDIKKFIKNLHDKGYNIQVRTNLTVLLDYEDFIKFYADNNVKLVASLPCYEAAEVDSVRGEGTFNDSIKALKKLNEAGYGKKPSLKLDLVFNPEGAFLPPPQGSLEETYHKKLKEDFDIGFNNLIAIANMPIGRFSQHLRSHNEFDEYMSLLKETYNPDTLIGLMCRHQINIAWDGTVYDCDFNLAMNLPMKIATTNINDSDFKIEEILERNIVIGKHCFGCTAGQGSSCGGALTES